MDITKKFTHISIAVFVVFNTAFCGDTIDGIYEESTDDSPVADDSDGTDTGQTDPGDTDSENGDITTVIGLVIDDFEDGDHIALTGGSWYTYDDNGDNGLSTINISRNDEGDPVMDGDGYQSERALSLSYSLDVGDWIWEPYIGWGVHLGEEAAPFDAGAYNGLTYAYKGSAHFVYIFTYEVTNYDYYRAYLPATDTWQVVNLSFDDFAQGGWDGIFVPFNLANVGHIGWEYKGETGDTGSILVDNVAFLSEVGTPAEKDLTIHEPDPPEDDVIDTIEINTPLQAQVLAALDKGYNLTNWLEQEKFESYNFDATDIHQLADNGFGALRLPIDLDLYIANRDAYFAGEAEFVVEDLLFEILDNFEQWTAEAGLSFTIDYHQYDASLDMNDPKYVDAVIGLWRAVAAHFSNNPREDLFYEIMNEPELAAGVDAVPQSDWTGFAEEIISAVRDVDTTHIILFGDVEWNGISPLLTRTPFDDDKVAYVFHFYEPFIFTHQGAGWAGMPTVHDIPYPYTVDRWSEYSADFGFASTQATWQFDQLRDYYRIGNKSWMRNRINEVKQWAVENNVPVLCNEFGAYDRTAQKEDIINYYSDLTDIFKELEIPWQIWFMIMNDEGEIDPDLKDALDLK